jgi:hypothetical protein
LFPALKFTEALFCHDAMIASRPSEAAAPSTRVAANDPGGCELAMDFDRGRIETNGSVRQVGDRQVAVGDRETEG